MYTVLPSLESKTKRSGDNVRSVMCCNVQGLESALMHKFVSRASLDTSQHSAVDSHLKSLKLITRRLHSALTIHETELCVLERLIYKNKNQHRKALFWRNVIELRRYSERVDNLKLFDDLQVLRSLFYGSSSLR